MHNFRSFFPVRHLETSKTGPDHSLSKNNTLNIFSTTKSEEPSDAEEFPKKKPATKSKTSPLQSSLPKLVEDPKESLPSKPPRGDEDLQKENIQSKFRNSGAQRMTEQKINALKYDVSKEDLNKFNPALRWEYKLDDIEAERKRIDEYKKSRRARYYAMLGIQPPEGDTPMKNSEYSKDLNFLFH